MIIQLNGFKEAISEDLSIKDLIVLFEEGDPDLIVELNGTYIPPKDYSNKMVIENSVIEFINPNLGG